MKPDNQTTPKAINMKTWHRRKLPHLFRPCGTYFVTCRLSGTLPNFIIDRLKHEKSTRLEQIDQRFMNGELDSQQVQRARDRANVHHFLDLDKLLHKQQSGQCFFNNPLVAKQVTDSLHHLDGLKIKLWAYCIMPDHTHKVFSLLDSSMSLSHVMHSFKGFTGFRCNGILKRKTSFWQEESLDHLVRTHRQKMWFIDYCLQNPVKAGLVAHWADWPYSFVAEEYREMFAEEVVC